MDGYSIGIDLGTNSSGIAVIRDNFKLLKVKNKNLWSVMKFDEGQTATTRRLYRANRRLLVRRRNRINNLRMLIEKEIIKIDDSFFQRLEDSFKHNDDKSNKEYKYNLFVKKDFNDKHYYSKYPTIYHLREELVRDKSKKDIRLIYLALHHIIKYRGNFLYQGEDLQSVSGNIDELIKKLGDLCSEHFNLQTNFKVNGIVSILDDKYKSKKDKVKDILALDKYSKEDKQAMEQIFNGILGLTLNLSKIQLELDFGDIDKIQMSDEGIDEKITELSNILGDRIEVFEVIRNIYTKIKLRDILNNKNYISEAMIAKYNKFGKDLKTLKFVIKEYCGENEYNRIFKCEDKDVENYKNYMNNTIKTKDKGLDKIREAFYNKIKLLLKDVNSKEAEYILTEIEQEKFLIKLNITSNSVIPYQVHLKELEKILDNQGKYYDILEKNTDKIKSIVTFRIPYYVGPLSKVKTQFSWMTRYDGKENEKIYPWNFHNIVDIDKSAENFITRMTSYCSYLPNEPVLPFNSILYTEYLYYNEVNKIRFNDELLDNMGKEQLKKEVFMTKNSVSEKDLINWYKKRNSALIKDEIKVTGFMGDGKVNATLKPIRNFTSIYGNITSENIGEIERIIYYLTVFEDKKILRRKLDSEFNLKEEHKNKILQFKYSGWGRLSKKLLQELKITKSDCSKVCVIDELKTTNLNFMQIINDNTLGFNKKIEEIIGSDRIEKINYEEHIKPLQGSPALKKAIYQASKQIEEVIKLTGRYPNNIYVEVAREDQESKRTLTRNKKMLELYNEIENKTATDKEIVKKLKNSKFKVDTEALYLYLMQRGKCMYSRRTLDIDTLSMYEIDHIIPRSLIKDDSFSNKVLVIKEENQKKSSGALADKIINDMKPFWSELLKCKLISKRKFDNLTNYSGTFSKEAEKGFINRQLVEVRQITKHVVNLLNRAYGYKGTNVYAIKAELVGNFKKQFNIYKSREINDFHHAKDAYATAVVGQYITKRFSNLNSEFIYDDYKDYSKKATGKNKFGFIISSMLFDYIDEDGKLVWKADKEISKIKKIFSYNDPFVVKKTEILSGQMFNLTRHKKPIDGVIKGDKIPFRNNINEYLAPEKYGYYEGIQEAYYAIVEFTDKKKKVKRIIGVPIMYANKFKNNVKALQQYLEQKGYKDVKVIKDRIPKYQKIVYEGDEFYLVSSKEWQNAKQLKLSVDYYNWICILNDFNEIKKLDVETIDKLTNDIFNMLIKKVDENYTTYGGVVNKLKTSTDKFKLLINENKINLINEILKLTMANSACANLKLIDGTDREGRIRNKDKVDVNNITFIYESYLGINRREVKY